MICKAVVQEGPRKGESCKFPCKEADGYCGRHGRNKIYDEGVQSGKKWCRFFFRGCEFELSENDIIYKLNSCEKCRIERSKKSTPCAHEGCKFKVLSGKFCKKHERDLYYLEETEKGIKYCDIARGCFNVLGDNKSCDKCLEKNRIVDSKRHNMKRQITMASQLNESSNRVCMKCQSTFETFNTKLNCEALTCRECCEKQAKLDKKREGRKRNYKVEHLKNLEIYYKIYINKSVVRGYGNFQLNFDKFTTLVKSPCYYCKYINDSETNGIDRINNDIGYTEENCVAACWKCNRMKHFYHPLFFLEKCKIIAKEMIPAKDFFKKWSLYYTRTTNRNYTAYKKEAEARELSFDLTQTQWDWLTRSPCYLCGYQCAKGIGIDRLDNTIRGYNIENCRSCCGSCNSMKNELTLPELIEQCILISSTWSNTSEFRTIPLLNNPLKDAEVKGHIMNPLERTHWKAQGLYYEILSDTTDHFFEVYKEVYTEKEMSELSKLIKESTKENSLKTLKTLINTLKKRRSRLILHKI